MPLLPLLAVPDLPPPRRERELVAFERELVAFEREPVFPDEFAAEPDAFRAVDERPVPLADDLAAPAEDFFAVDRDVELFDAPPLDRLAVERAPADLRFAADPDDLRARPELLEEPALSPLADACALHLPDITRCAASATASAISEPSFVALATTLLAAWDAVSAASSPASRILLRAAGLAAMAAAAAVNPAASISLLIAAFASLSTVVLLEPERDALPLERDDDGPARDPPDPADEEEVREEEVLRVDLAIICLPRSDRRHFNAVSVPE